MDAGQTISLDPITLVTQASLPVRLTVATLLAASTGLWIIAVAKFRQLSRLASAERGFLQTARASTEAHGLMAAATAHEDAPGARVVLALASRPQGVGVARLEAAAEQAVVAERKRASSLLSPLGTIASAAPYVGLFGTVYGIMDAFVRIGAEQSASLPVVAPAIGEALFTTAVGLATAIPAVVLFNALDKRASDLLAALEASSSEWVAMLAARNDYETPQRSHRPPSVASGGLGHTEG